MAVTLPAYARAVAAVEAVSWRGMRPGLERTEALLRALDNPHHGLRGVLVAGTNGKGSVCALVDSVLRAAGIRTVLLTKPHLTSYRERVVIDGEWIGEVAFATLIDTVVAAAASLPEDEQPTGFELMTVAGILAAAQHDAEALVCEVGLGGRLDSTNVLDLGIAALTNVALDHQQHLGDTVVAIAREKAAIIKPGNDVINGATQPALGVIRERCDAVGARLRTVEAHSLLVRDLGLDGIEVAAHFAGEPITVATPLVGAFQAANVAVAVEILEVMRAGGFAIDAGAMLAGCATAAWRGRMQWIDGSPPVLIDGAHNAAGMAAMANALTSLRGDRRLVVVFAAMQDKDVASMAATLRSASPAALIVTKPAVARACDPEMLAVHFDAGTTATQSVGAALDIARRIAGPDGLVLACGSLFLAGEVLTLLGA